MRTHPDIAALRNNSLSNPEEERLLREAVIVGECEDIIYTARSIIREALSPNDAMKWFAQVGLFIPKIGTATGAEPSLTERSSPDRVKRLPELGKEFLPPYPAKWCDITIFHILRPGIYILMSGPKDTGKTICAFLSISQLLSGLQPWPFFRRTCEITENICYVDGETEQDKLDEYLTQFGLKKFINKRLFLLSIFDDHLPEFCAKFSLRSEQFREGLKQYVLDKGCRYLFLDNLLSLTGNKCDASAPAILEWISELQRVGICVVLIHHSELDDYTKARGNADYSNKARAIIQLAPKETLLEAKNLPSSLRPLATDPMLTVGIHYQCVKCAPILTRSTFWVSLPLGGSDFQFRCAFDASGEQIDCPWPDDLNNLSEVAMGTSPMGNEALACPAVDRDDESPIHDKIQCHPPLSPAQSMVLTAIEDAGGSAKRAKIQAECQLSENTTLKILRELIDRKLIEVIGKGKDIYYARKLQ